MIDAQPSIAPKRIAKIIPDRINLRIRMERAYPIDPPLSSQAPKRLAHLDSKQRIVDPPLGLIYVTLRRNHVVVAGENHRRIAGDEGSGVDDQPLEPA